MDGDALELEPGVTLVRGGGHFPGGTVLHWAWERKDAAQLLAGDILQVTPGAHRVSFMWSYPNLMPLPASEVRGLAARVSARPFERIYGAFLGQDVPADGQGILARSAQRYIEPAGRRDGVRSSREGRAGLHRLPVSRSL